MPSLPDFSDTEVAFRDQSDAALRQTYWLFGMMNQSWLVTLGSGLGLLALRLRLPLVATLIRRTLFQQFCGGTTLADSLSRMDSLNRSGVFSVLDYGAEGKQCEADFNRTSSEAQHAVAFAAGAKSCPFVSIKLTGLGSTHVLEALARGDSLKPEEMASYKCLRQRLDDLCALASEKGVSIFIDAEESWLQPPMDDLAGEMMAKYNTERAVVYNTFQMYRTDRLAFLKISFQKSRKEKYVLGAKLVRGAYMEKENARAIALGLESPIHPSKEATDQSFDEGIRFCLDNFQEMACCNASHNLQSVMAQVRAMAELGIPFDHPHLTFCQLLGMSDILTYNLASSGFRVGKYVVYGQVREVVPYLIRRAQENSSVTGDMSRELAIVRTEMVRRGLLASVPSR